MNTRVLAACLLLAAGPACAGVIVIRGATVHTLGPAGTLAAATVILRDGRIEQVGRDLAIPDGAAVVEAAGKEVTPGLFDAYGRLGIEEVDLVEETVDSGAKGLPYSAAFSVAEAIDPRSVRLAVNRSEGITSAVVAPEAVPDATGIAPVIAGQAALLHLGTAAEPQVSTPAGFVFTYGEAGAENSGGARGMALLRLRELLDDARDYARNRAAFEAGARRDYAATRVDLEALQPLLAGRVPLLIEAQRASDILAALRVAGNYGLRSVIIGGAEAWRVADQLAHEDVPVIFDPFDNLPAAFESLDATLANAARLHAAGVAVAFVTSAHYNPRNVRQLAGNAVAHGLPYAAALAAITAVPARTFGAAATTGTLEPGRRADLVIWSGDPLETSSFAEQVFIGGELMPAQNRQTLLRERYRRLGGPLPPGYTKPPR
ncbi:MAG: amidohydrolase family protein [Gammaproteobacteria bacterium]|nr:amidohydrolase family protein [Gammaproteobacteria bacterium]